MKEKLVKKLTSRKFIVALSGILTGVAIIVNGNMTEGITAVLTSIVSYLIAEGMVDAKGINLSSTDIQNKEDIK